VSAEIRNEYEKLKSRLKDLYFDFEIREKAKLVSEINHLKRKKNAIILGHNYMEPALYYGVADITGDSLMLCQEAAKTSAKIIVFCGVRFMAETAKIVNPERMVLLPSLKAGCSLAASLTADDIRGLRSRFPGVPVVVYINTYAEVKAEADICCTSSNAAHIIDSLRSDTVIFLPDEYLARNVAKETGRHIIFPTVNTKNSEEGSSDSLLEKVIIGWHGRCEVHERFTVEDIDRARLQFPDVLVLAHPECNPEVISEADFSGSTAAMIRYVKDTNAPRYLLLTECSMGDNILAENSEKEIVRLCSVRCPHMNQITLEQTKKALELGRYQIEVPEPIRERAKHAIHRMLQAV